MGCAMEGQTSRMRLHARDEGGEARGWWARHAAPLTAAVRGLFGLIWMIDGAMKFVFLTPADVPGMVRQVAQGQPAWLLPWFSFWKGVVSANPSLFLWGTGVLEITIGACLVAGFLRKTVYLGSIGLALMIWSVVEGFGGPYGPGSTDIGPAVMYAVLGFALVVVEAVSGPSPLSLDAWLERRVRSWHRFAEFVHPASAHDAS